MRYLQRWRCDDYQLPSTHSTNVVLILSYVIRKLTPFLQFVINNMSRSEWWSICVTIYRLYLSIQLLIPPVCCDVCIISRYRLAIIIITFWLISISHLLTSQPFTSYGYAGWKYWKEKLVSIANLYFQLREDDIECWGVIMNKIWI